MGEGCLQNKSRGFDIVGQIISTAGNKKDKRPKNTIKNVFYPSNVSIRQDFTFLLRYKCKVTYQNITCTTKLKRTNTCVNFKLSQLIYRSCLLSTYGLNLRVHWDSHELWYYEYKALETDYTCLLFALALYIFPYMLDVIYIYVCVSVVLLWQ